MATKQEQEYFINAISPFICEIAPKFNVLTPSAVIAQACHETGYGVDPKAMNKVNHFNFFGLKYKANRVDCNSGYFKDGSTEEYTKGVYTPISTDWYAFSDLYSGVLGYYQFLFAHTHHYDTLKGITDSYAYLKEIKRLGYATGSDYAEHCYDIVKAHNLTRFDNVTPNTTAQNVVPNNESNGISNLCNMFGTANITKSPNRKIEYIVIHYTAGTSSKSGASKNVASYFNKVTTKASADYIVDDEIITQYNGDIKNQYTWHCGGSKYTTKGGSMYNKITNKNSIGIEICSNNITGKVTKANDSNWYYTDASLDNTIKLCEYLMKKYNIKADNIYRHYDVTGKLCPGIYGWNEDTGNIDRWTSFKKKLGSTVNNTVTDPTTDFPYVVQITAQDLNYREGPGTSYKINGVVHKPSKYTIVAETDGWGKLKSGAGWINLAYTQRV